SKYVKYLRMVSRIIRIYYIHQEKMSSKKPVNCRSAVSISVAKSGRMTESKFGQVNKIILKRNN
ncbi:MAG: hypothetical protein K5647_06515, partial [Clostridiales bacterium]|nr:hypothetical protein [Clostridiales bacterium]